jgi:DNA-binding transcriptional regulator YdaS (Cro superfamily)
MRLTEKIIAAIKEACVQAGNQSAFAQKIGIKHQNISRYLNGAVTEITPKTMGLLFPEIKSFLPEDYCPEEFLPNTIPNKMQSQDCPELVALKRKAKIANLRLEKFYINRKIKQLEEADPSVSE